MERTFMNKDLIQKRFAKNLDTYNDNAKIQKRMAERLISFLGRKEYDNILEIGCGTGLLTNIINSQIQFENYIANDIVSECEEYIKKINPNFNFVSGDIEKEIKNSDKKYDLIISNAALQWVDNLQGLVDTLFSKLKDGGELLFSTFGQENFREVFFAQGKSLPYYSVSELADLLTDFNPKVEQEIHVLAFKTPKDILRHFKLTGVNALETTTWTKSDVLKFENAYNNVCSNTPTLTYNPIYIKITK